MWDIEELVLSNNAERLRVHGIRSILDNYERGLIPEHTALRQLRERDVAETQIWELLDEGTRR